MVETQEIAQYIQDGLSELTENYHFSVIPMAGDYVSRLTKLPQRGELPFVNAGLVSLPAEIVPIKDLNNFYMAFSLHFIVKKEYVNDIDAIIRQYIETHIGTAARFGEYVGIIGMDMPMSGAVASFPNVGQGVPLSVSVYFRFIKSGMLSNECEFYINGEKMIVLDATVLRSRIAQTDNTNNSTEMRSSIGQQGLTVRATLPYLNTTVTVKLANDIVHGKLNAVYKLIYSDGLVKIGDSNFNEYVVLQNGSLNYEAGKIVSLSAEFLLARSDIYGEEISALEE